MISRASGSAATNTEFLKALQQGGELLSSGQVSAAREHLETAHRLSPNNESGQNLLGLAYFKLGLYDQAAELYRALVKENPADSTLRVNLGLVYLKGQALPHAVHEFEVATDLEPDHKKAHNYLGLALAQLGEYRRAKYHFEQAGSVQMVEKMDRALASEEVLKASAPPPPPVAPPTELSLDEEVYVTPPSRAATVVDVPLDIPGEVPVEVEVEVAPVLPSEGQTLEDEISEPPSALEVVSFSGESAAPIEIEITSPYGQAASPEIAVEAAEPEPDENSGKRWDLDDSVEAADPSGLPVLELGLDSAEAVENEPPAEEEHVSSVGEVLSKHESDPAFRKNLRQALRQVLRPNPDSAQTEAPGPRLPLEELAASLVLEAGEGEPGFSSFPEGFVASVRGEMLLRLSGMVAASGPLSFQKENQRQRGRSVEKPFGEGGQQFFRAAGQGEVWLSPAGQKFERLFLGGDSAYFREDVLWGFEEAVSYENGRLPVADGSELRLVHLRGTGQILLRLSGALRSVQVQMDKPAHLPLSEFVGWVGALSPALQDHGVVLSGEGYALCAWPMR